MAARPTDAVAAALAGQLALQAEDWGEVGELRARMGCTRGVERQGRPGGPRPRGAEGEGEAAHAHEHEEG
jgi:hypothetical protein